MCLAKVNDGLLLGWGRWAAPTWGCEKQNNSELSHCGLCTSLPQPCSSCHYFIRVQQEKARMALTEASGLQPRAQ